jgi:hypothetical protein
LVIVWISPDVLALIGPLEEAAVALAGVDAVEGEV